MGNLYSLFLLDILLAEIINYFYSVVLNYHYVMMLCSVLE